MLDPGSSLPAPSAEAWQAVLVFEESEGRRLDPAPFRKWGLTPLIEGREDTFLAITNEKAQAFLTDLVETYGREEPLKFDNWRKQLEAIAGIREYGRDDRYDHRLAELTFKQLETIDLLLWPSTIETAKQRNSEAKARLKAVRSLVKQAQSRNSAIREITSDPRPDTTMIRVAADRKLLDELLEHPLVERVRPPLAPRVTRGDLVNTPAPSPVPTPQGTPIGVIDDLITDNQMLIGVVTGRSSFPKDANFGPPSWHGTFVAGVAAYGDLHEYLASPDTHVVRPHPIVGARIMEQHPHIQGRSHVPGQLHTAIEDAVRWLHSQGVKIIVCAVADDCPDNTAAPAETVATIDSLVRELDVVMVLASGNVSGIGDQHWLDHYPDYLDDPNARVASPATAALAVTVGSKARRDTPASSAYTGNTLVPIAAAQQPSPFTRSGPTRGRSTSKGTAKPEFVGHGGNWAWDSLVNRTDKKNSELAVISLAPAGITGGRVFAADSGTSFSAPQVAREIASIATRYPSASANLLRALTALAGDCKDLDKQAEAIISAYGEPSADRILESHAHRVIMYFEGEIPPNSTTVHTFPVPEEFATGARSQRIRAALAFDPPVRRSRREYLACDMAFDVVRNMTYDEVAEAYRRQPTQEELAVDPTLAKVDLPGPRFRITMRPTTTDLAANTLICRTGQRMAWSPDDEGYHVIVTHTPRPWAKTKADSAPQSYALAVELALDEEVDIDLYALVKAQLQAEAHADIRLRVQG
ncbi:MAG: S8 family peptidase [Promicromonosporaceae bacterium]|nr:S8 family peptidase [Promicromonosporaceae bacterium]